MGDRAGIFHQAFERWARAVRTRLLMRRVLTGAAAGAVGASGVAALLWWLRLGAERPLALGLVALGAIAGGVYAMRRRWSDTDVALYLDARLEAREAISTAVELRTNAERTDAARAVVVEHAARALAEGDAKRARPRVLEPVHAMLPVGAIALVWLCLAALPAPPPLPPPPTGTDVVTMADLAGLEKIEALEKLDGRDAAEAERLKKIAEQAKKLREKLSTGVERREALDDIARMRDSIRAERLQFGDQKNRRGLEAAIGKLGASDKLKKAAQALGDGDLAAFDEEMQKLANQAEDADREAAKKALEEAAKAAKEAGADDVAKALEEQKELFEKREAKAEALRELAKGLEGKLSDQAKKDLEEFGQTGDPEAMKRLTEALEDALDGLSEEERKRLKEKLQEQLDKSDGNARPMTKEQLEDMAMNLDTPEGKEALKEMLKEMAKDPSSPESQREQGLDDAEKGGADAQRGLGAVPIPMEGAGPGQSGQQPGNKQSDPGNGKDGPSGPGSDHDEGTGNHDGTTPRVEGDELRAKANAKLQKGVPMLGATKGRGAARAGETANEKGTGALGEAAPGEVGGVERSEVPEEYREQVGRYFTP